MILFINRNSQQLTLLISKLYDILVIMGEQNQSQTLITEKEIEEWVEILETVKQEHLFLKQKLRQNRGENL